MANQIQLERIKQGVDSWNAWRQNNANASIELQDAPLGKVQLPNIDLSSARLDRIRLRWAYMREARLAGAVLAKADLRIVDLSRADLRGADLSGATLDGAYLREANLRGANLTGAGLVGVNFDRAVLADANLSGANLTNVVLVDADLRGANLNGSRVYGASVWNVDTSNSSQRDLIITRRSEATITVDNLKVAQFIYLILNNVEIRNVIDTVTSKMVLILGRFTPERKAVLEVIRDELRKLNYLPVVFDFDRPDSRDLDETINLLANMAKFVIADISDPKSVPQELKGIVERLPSVPVQFLLAGGEEEISMLRHFRKYPWVLPPIIYGSANDKHWFLKEVIEAVDRKAQEIRLA